MKRRPRALTAENRRDYQKTLELLARAVAKRPTPTRAPLLRHFVVFAL